MYSHNLVRQILPAFSGMADRYPGFSKSYSPHGDLQRALAVSTAFLTRISLPLGSQSKR